VNLRLALLVSFVAVVGACGTDARPPGPDGASGGSSSTAQAGDSSFPVTITRTGGVAGFRDTVVVQADGSTTVTSRTGATTTCRIGSAELAILSGEVTAAVTAATTSVPDATPDHVIADAISTTLTAGSRGPYTSVEPPDPAPAWVGGLLDDVTGPSPAHQICTRG